MSVFGGDFTRNLSPLQSLIARAVDPYKLEPDYAAHLEVAEYINKKKANTPREAAQSIARIINNRNPHISLLALALLQTLVQQCGYPFHLQIATKEFLNELVRRFPERPPPFPGPVMSRILEVIREWTEGICVESRWKEDLGNIRDMYRLLTFKGYRFRGDGGGTRNAPAVASTSNLKTASELESEDREAQEAKLQELIRRGTPRDLAAAQELMKVLAGAVEPEKKPDYRAQSLAELNKLEQKVILLNELLDNVDMERGERFADGDAYDQVSEILSAARPKIQKWISDAESGDPEMLDIFLQMNDQINSVLNRYESFKKGDFSAAKNPIPAELHSTSRTQDTSLIDLEEEPASSTPAVDDLAAIFGPTINTPHPAQQQQQQQQHVAGITVTQPTPSGGANGANADLLAGLFNNSPSPTPLHGAAGGTHGHAGIGSISLPWTPGPGPSSSSNSASQSQSPGPASSGTFWSLQAGTGVVPKPAQTLRQQQATATAATTTTATSSGSTPQGKDPFADLAGLF